MSVFRKDRATCLKCAEAFPDLVEGRTEGPVHEEVRRRMKEVAFCSRCFEAYRRTVDLAKRSLGSRAASSAARERLMEFLRSRTGKQR